jgi:hypothetical protein
VNDEVTRDGDASSLVVSKASNLGDDLSDEDDGIDGLANHLDLALPLTKGKKSRKKKVYDTSNLRRSTRKRIKKKF